MHRAALRLHTKSQAPSADATECDDTSEMALALVPRVHALAHKTVWLAQQNAQLKQQLADAAQTIESLAASNQQGATNDSEQVFPEAKISETSCWWLDLVCCKTVKVLE